jgi:hypothetical protein
VALVGLSGVGIGQAGLEGTLELRAECAQQVAELPAAMAAGLQQARTSDARLVFGAGVRSGWVLAWHRSVWALRCPVKESDA